MQLASHFGVDQGPNPLGAVVTQMSREQAIFEGLTEGLESYVDALVEACFANRPEPTTYMKGLARQSKEMEVWGRINEFIRDLNKVPSCYTEVSEWFEGELVGRG